jgi:hypothetical protein
MGAPTRPTGIPKIHKSINVVKFVNVVNSVDVDVDTFVTFVSFADFGKCHEGGCPGLPYISMHIRPPCHASGAGYGHAENDAPQW